MGAQLPDIIVERTSPTDSHTFLLEVKFTEDRDYVAESVSKLLAYVNHCRSCLRDVKICGIICPYLNLTGTLGGPIHRWLDILLIDASEISRVLWDMVLLNRRQGAADARTDLPMGLAQAHAAGGHCGLAVPP